MLLGVLLALACAAASADKSYADYKADILNTTNIDKRVINRLSSLFGSNKTLDTKDFALLNKTAQSLGIEKDLVDKLSNLLKKNETLQSGILTRLSEDAKDTSYNAYEDESGKEGELGPIEVSPDYASSVVLASDLLSLTSAVSSVNEKVCREQGYRFLDGLLLNKRWALRMEDDDSPILKRNKSYDPNCAPSTSKNFTNESFIEALAEKDPDKKRKLEVQDDDSPNLKRNKGYDTNCAPSTSKNFSNESSIVVSAERDTDKKRKFEAEDDDSSNLKRNTGYDPNCAPSTSKNLTSEISIVVSAERDPDKKRKLEAKDDDSPNLKRNKGYDPNCAQSTSKMFTIESPIVVSAERDPEKKRKLEDYTLISKKAKRSNFTDCVPSTSRVSGNERKVTSVFDASAKSPQGLLFGSSYHLGNFDECVGIDDASDGGLTVEGQYCLATIKWPHQKAKKIRTGRGETLRWAVCVPSACSAKAVAEFVSSVISHTVGNRTTVEVTERDCYSRRPLTITSLDIGFLSLILFFAAILLFSTLFEIYSIKWGSNKTSVFHDLVISFSVINNTKKLISCKQNHKLGLECVTGIKTLAMVFIIGGHACLFIASGPVMDAEAWDRLVRHPADAFMLNNSLLVDTFLFLSAFLFCRLLLIELDKRKGRLNVIPILIFRYIRVTPAYLVVILFYMTWLPKIGEGPLWEDRMQLEQERCMTSWWANILYINNYVNTDHLCMFQSWYLSVDTQLFFVAPIFIYSLWRWRRVGPIFLSISVVVSVIIPAVITYKDNLDPTLLFYAKEFTDIVSNFYFKQEYIKTHMKLTTYFMGLLTGFILHRIQENNYKLSGLLKTFAWITSIVLGTVTTFSVSVFYQDWYQYSNIEAASYISLHKVAWGIANGWLIIACATGSGGVIGKLLSWKFLVPLSRLTFCAYLVNGVVELYYVGQLRHPLHITFFTVVANAISHIILTFFLAALLCLTFESPIHGIEKILLRMFARPVLSDNARRDQEEISRNTSQSKIES